MPELVQYKVRVEVEYTVVGVTGFGDAVACAEEQIAPALKYARPSDLNRPYLRDAKIVDIQASRD